MPAPIQNQQELQFRGYAVEDTENWEKFKLIDFQPKPMGEHDVDIKTEFCGVCGSDVHTITGGWGKVNLVSWSRGEFISHMAIQFSKALGCDEIVAFSHSNNKEKDAMTLGATKFVATREGGFQKPLLSSLDFIICTADVAAGVAFKELLETLVPMGKFVMVALPDDKLPSLERSSLLSSAFFDGCLLRESKKEALEMLQLAADKGVKPWIEVMSMSDVSKAVRGLKDGKPRYRYVLKQDIDQ
ncbi:hypothetical protein D9613_008848 [Agrocybe pediades]|uniref:Alcohol dehydrogenase-like C-terminal domain-containing protein n=1 Tax=Agrocybe pediades TaxID=84607 RepID=A0A8H4QSG0_9AGAR|nr:hypothetical protein D9613_008848 [Agrocybe pediades]